MDEKLLKRLCSAFVVDASGCWLWTRRLDRGGYSQIKRTGERIATTGHRASYELFRGPVGAGLELDHLCRVRHCVNPDHLEPVTPKENQLRGETFAARNAARTHCPAGHPYEGENLWVNTRSRRVCRACENARCLRYYYRKRAEARAIG